MLKKSLAIVLSVILVFCFFTGCEDTNKNNVSPSQSQPYTEDNSNSTFEEEMGWDNSLQDDSLDNSFNDDMLDNSDDGMLNEQDNSMDSSYDENSSSTVANATTNQNWSTILVNAQNPLPEDFKVEVCAIKGYPEREFDKRAVQSLENMLQDAEKAGCKAYLVSSYRSVSYQKSLYKRKVNSYLDQGLTQQQAEQNASTWVAKPGTSEHNLGLAADIVSGDWYTYNSDLTQEFENTDLFAWLNENADKYGFILRYPEDKTQLTGVNYEPWHYRYVGIDAAKFIKQNKICLEEYHQ